jgi:CRISPR-associated protein Csb1
MNAISFEELKKLVSGDAVAIRGTAILEPAGGPADKVFPPTHSVGDRATTRYAFEKRRIGEREVDCVLLDSVQSQANRMEEALQTLWADKQIALPVIEVKLSEVAPDVGVVTSLTAPHRVADALLRDSLLDGTLFRHSELGRSFTDATSKNAASLFKVCPTGLVFGLWDSTGPKGGLGSKFARTVVSEIVGIGATAGVKTSSRIDPTGIVTKAAEIFEAKDPNEGWTHDLALAKTEKGKAVKVGDGRVSEVNHSNIPPSIDPVAGGVTIDHALHTVVLSLAAIRKLSFGGHDVEARTTLVALGLLSILAAQSRGHDLRSRCLLVPKKGESLKLEIVGRDGAAEPVALDLDDAISLYTAAVAALPDELRFTSQPGQVLATLKPSPKLAHLIRRSRELAASGAGVEGE